MNSQVDGNESFYGKTKVLKAILGEELGNGNRGFSQNGDDNGDVAVFCWSAI